MRLRVPAGGVGCAVVSIGQTMVTVRCLKSPGNQDEWRMALPPFLQLFGTHLHPKGPAFYSLNYRDAHSRRRSDMPTGDAAPSAALALPLGRCKPPAVRVCVPVHLEAQSLQQGRDCKRSIPRAGGGLHTRTPPPFPPHPTFLASADAHVLRRRERKPNSQKMNGYGRQVAIRTMTSRPCAIAPSHAVLARETRRDDTIRTMARTQGPSRPHNSARSRTTLLRVTREWSKRSHTPHDPPLIHLRALAQSSHDPFMRCSLASRVATTIRTMASMHGPSRSHNST